MGSSKRATVCGTLQWWVPFMAVLFHTQHKHTTAFTHQHGHGPLWSAQAGTSFYGVCGVSEQESETAFLSNVPHWH